MLGDILEDSWTHQEFMQKIHDKGLEQGRLKEQREMLVEIVKARFPDCVALAQEAMETVDNADALRHVTIKISIAQSEDEARRLLLKLHPERH